MKFLITTSWDDGHPLDLRLADMLLERDIRATFYIPRSNTLPVLAPSAIRRLAANFEIGAHTLTHCDLTRLTPSAAREEITVSKDWVEQVTGKPCRMFCFPQGRFHPEHLRYVWEAGYSGCRTVELLSLDAPQGAVMPTTIQAFPHSRLTYAKNLAKRLRLTRLLRLLSLPPDWSAAANLLLREAELRGGVFHLWGHSWEFHDPSHWTALDAVLDLMRAFRDSAPSLTNAEVCSLHGIGHELSTHATFI